jgi:hypothetical protein
VTLTDVLTLEVSIPIGNPILIIGEIFSVSNVSPAEAIFPSTSNSVDENSTEGFSPLLHALKRVRSENAIGNKYLIVQIKEEKRVSVIRNPLELKEILTN